jgi:CRISPR-associated protein Csb2
MLVLEVEFLTARCVASQRDDRSTLEWPPHPTRLFSALAAAYFECDLGQPERDALTWIEGLQPPVIYARARTVWALEVRRRLPCNGLGPSDRGAPRVVRHCSHSRWST